MSSTFFGLFIRCILNLHRPDKVSELGKNSPDMKRASLLYGAPRKKAITDARRGSCATSNNALVDVWPHLAMVSWLVCSWLASICRVRSGCTKGRVEQTAGKKHIRMETMISVKSFSGQLLLQKKKKKMRHKDNFRAETARDPPERSHRRVKTAKVTCQHKIFVNPPRRETFVWISTFAIKIIFSNSIGPFKLSSQVSKKYC